MRANNIELARVSIFICVYVWMYLCGCVWALVQLWIPKSKQIPFNSIHMTWLDFTVDVIFAAINAYVCVQYTANTICPIIWLHELWHTNANNSNNDPLFVTTTILTTDTNATQRTHTPRLCLLLFLSFSLSLSASFSHQKTLHRFFHWWSNERNRDNFILFILTFSRKSACR